MTMRVTPGKGGAVADRFEFGEAGWVTLKRVDERAFMLMADGVTVMIHSTGTVSAALVGMDQSTVDTDGEAE